MIRFNHKGFTLIELIIFIIIGAIFIPASLVAFTTVMNDLLVPDYQVKARFYAEQKMEELTSKPFTDSSLDVRAKDSEPYPLYGTTNYRMTWEIQLLNPDTNPLETGSDPNYKKISIYVVAPDSRQYAVSTIITRRPRS